MNDNSIICVLLIFIIAVMCFNTLLFYKAFVEKKQSIKKTSFCINIKEPQESLNYCGFCKIDNDDWKEIKSEEVL